MSEIKQCLTKRKRRHKKSYFSGWKNIIKEARAFKKIGDSYMGCSAEMMKAELEREKMEELEERLSAAEKEAKQAEMEARRAKHRCLSY